MKVAIHKDGIEGFVSFKPHNKELMVSHPDEGVRSRVKQYLTSDRLFDMPGDEMGQKWMEKHNPTEHPQYMDMALCEMSHRTGGVHVNWGHPENEGWDYASSTPSPADNPIVKSIDDDDEEYEIIN